MPRIEGEICKCKEEYIFKGLYPCDEDVLDQCCVLMKENNIGNSSFEVDFQSSCFTQWTENIYEGQLKIDAEHYIQ